MLHDIFPVLTPSSIVSQIKPTNSFELQTRLLRIPDRSHIFDLQEFKLLPEIARMRPKIDIEALKEADTVEKALETVKKAMSV